MRTWRWQVQAPVTAVTAPITGVRRAESAQKKPAQEKARHGGGLVIK